LRPLPSTDVLSGGILRLSSAHRAAHFESFRTADRESHLRSHRAANPATDETTQRAAFLTSYWTADSATDECAHRSTKYAALDESFFTADEGPVLATVFSAHFAAYKAAFCATNSHSK
jgi:hypothetical protein